jgi:glycosyltransferase involved in cell wall biosynthesis
MIYSMAYKRRYAQDEILCRSAVLMFPARVMLDDFRDTYDLDCTHSPSSYVVAYPGASFPHDSSTQAKVEWQNASRDNPFTFLFVGKGYRKKGLDVLLSACQKLKQNGADFRLLIAGLKEKSLDRIRLQSLNLANEVTYLGFRKDMSGVYAQARSIVLPSRIEPFGMAPVQGMLEGLVPIVSKVSGVAEVLTNGKDSLILENHLCAQDLCQLMQKLIDEPALCGLLSQQARITVDTLTWDKTVEQTLHAYNIVLSNKTRPQ